MEKIGNVQLDDSLYPGEDFYCDGPIEDEMLEIAQKYPKEEWNRIIVQRRNWPIMYHFSHIRANIVRWLPITKEDEVLEIGSGCGAITGALAEMAKQVDCIELSMKRSKINAYKHKEYDNIKINVGNFKDIEKTITKKYDFITLIGVFEYAESYMGTDTPYQDFLDLIKLHLKPSGKIVIAIENKYGLKYWAGCKEDHVAKLFEGLEGYTTTSGVKTFSKQELEGFVNHAGLNKYEFYYPYPDYKFPKTIYSDFYLPKVHELSNNTNNFDHTRLELFDEEKVFDNIIKDNLFPQYANSYVVIAQGE